MTIIDRYLLRRFVQNFLICFSSLMGLWIVIELSTNLDEFTRCGGKSGGVVFLAADYYGYKALGIFDQLAGMLAMVAAMFTISWIQRHNEMTALMALGVPRIRIVRPILIAASAVILLAAANRELLIPRFRSEISRRPQDLIGDRPQAFDSCCDNETDVILSGKNAYGDRQRIEEPELRMPLTFATMESSSWRRMPTIFRRRKDGRADTAWTTCASRRISTASHRCVGTGGWC